MAEVRGEKKKRQRLREWSELYDRMSESGIVLPMSLELERSVLGSMMIDLGAAEHIIDVLGERGVDDTIFYKNSHAYLYPILCKLVGRGILPDIAITQQELKRHGLSEKISASDLVEIASGVITTANAESHARVLLEKHAERELVKIGEEIKMRVAAGTDDTFELSQEIESRVGELSAIKRTKEFEHAGGLVLNTMKHFEAVEKRVRESGNTLTGVDTGLTDLNTLTGGFQASDLVIVGARPSMGKTGLALHFARACAVPRRSDTEPKAVAVLSQEMSNEQLMVRLICSTGGVPMEHAKRGQMNEHEWREIAKATAVIGDAPIYIDESAHLSASMIKRRLQKLIRQIKRELGLVIVDYLQLMGSDRDTHTKEAAVSENSRQLKAIAKEFHVPVVVLSQLSRELERRTDKRPILSDLRDSGSIEQDADDVYFLYRPEYYGEVIDGTQESTENIMEIIRAKGRNGPTGDVKVTFDRTTGEFYDRLPDFSKEERLQYGMAF